jgi:hypothetical protein
MVTAAYSCDWTAAAVTAEQHRFSTAMDSKFVIFVRFVYSYLVIIKPYNQLFHNIAVIGQ